MPGHVIRAWGVSTGTRQIRADEICICPARLPSQGTGKILQAKNRLNRCDL